MNHRDTESQRESQREPIPDTVNEISLCDSVRL